MSIAAETPEGSSPASPNDALADERAKVLAAIADVDTDLAQMNDPDADADVDFGEEGGEGAGASVDRDRSTSMRAQLMSRLDELDAAAARIEKGTYGVCRTCGGPIGEARLEALPAATECVGCAGAPVLTRRSR